MEAKLLDLTECLIPISDFSQGKAGKIFSDVADNNKEYIVLKNNQPTAVVISLEKYRDAQEKAEKLERILDKIENLNLIRVAQSRVNDNTTLFEDFINEQGFSLEELKMLSESVEFE